MYRFLITAVLATILFSSQAEARKRAETYIDANGVKRHVKTGKIYRDYKAIIKFKAKNPKPNDGHAYDIDHIVPLKRGGDDTPANMQWIRTEDHRRKSAGE